MTPVAEWRQRLLRGAATATVLGATMLAAGCGERNCQNTCNKVFKESECSVIIEGQSTEESIRRCVDRCETALQYAGGLCTETNGGKTECYDPEQKYPAAEQPDLENEQQAAAWMDCIWDHAPLPGKTSGCDEIDPQYGAVCAPIY